MTHVLGQKSDARGRFPKLPLLPLQLPTRRLVHTLVEDREP